MTSIQSGSFGRLSAPERAWTFPIGRIEIDPVVDDGRGPRQVLEDLTLDALSTGPCYVSFSGGRDSSAVLAVAVQVARREGLPMPVPITMVYPGIPEADESEWQDLVLDHLGVRERLRLVINDEHRWLGHRARRSLLGNGLVWPAALHLQGVTLEAVSGGTLLTGEGGDEVMGPRRITPITLLAKYRRRPSRSLVTAALAACVPNAVRRARFAAATDPAPKALWLTPSAKRQFARATATADLSPLRWDAATVDMLGRRAEAMYEHNYRLIARSAGVRIVHPLFEREFLAALGRRGGLWGFAGRSDLMRVLFGDLLPEPVLTRTSKAWFNRSRYGDEEREFAREWDGSGVDEKDVDVEVLRRHWLTDTPLGATAVLLHAAWLASQGLDDEGRAR